LLAASCGGPTTPAPAAHETGLVLLSLQDGTKKAEATIGSDPVAVIVSDDGRTAYVADSSPGDVYAVRLPDLHVSWRTHTGGAPFGLLLHDGRLFVSLFLGSAVVELDLASGKQQASHKVAEQVGMLAVDPAGRVIAASFLGEIDYLDGTSVRAGHGFAVTVAGGDVWTADYERAELVRIRDQHIVGLPEAVFPFWLAPGGGGKILVAAEGADEDKDEGAVFAFDPSTDAFDTLVNTHDPDQALLSGDTTFVAAHGDGKVLAVLADGKVKTWADRLPAVGLAADSALNLLVVVVNDHE
jgi:outer membrane protein assembly factor BamB